MITHDSIPTLIGSNVYGPDGDKIGTVGQIYLDNDSGAPEWATVKTGFFGTKESFVPLHEAESLGDGLRLPFDKNRIKGAPNIDADREVTPEEELALYEYYGISVAGTGTTGDLNADQSLQQDQTAMTQNQGAMSQSLGARGSDLDDDADASRSTTTGYDTTAGHDTSGPTTDDAMTRSEERVHAGTETQEAGRARLRKYVVTEQQQMTVPVTREEVRVDREPITDQNRDSALSGPALSEEEHEVVLTEEQPVVHKETVPVERVRLSKEQVTEDQTVNADVQKERIDTDMDAGVESRRDR
jgi:uncharacterized protein (TIGR02271 family)